MNRPRPWIPLDVAFFDQDTIRALGERFGAAGPLGVVGLIAEAGAAIPVRTRDFDVVDGRYAALARRVFTTPTVCQEVLAAAADLGLVELIEADDKRFKARLLKWQNWHPKDPSAKYRKAKQRAKAAADDDGWEMM